MDNWTGLGLALHLIA